MKTRSDKGGTANTHAGDPLDVQGILEFGPFRLYAKARLLERKGVPVKLGGRALEVLIALVGRAHEVVSKQELIARIWPNLEVEEGNLRFHVVALRKALGDGQPGARYVTNVKGRGYCFVAPVLRSGAFISAGDASPLTPAPLPARRLDLFGRYDVIQELAKRLQRNRFVSIVGPGGVGKSAVAVAMGQSIVGQFGGGIHIFDFGAPARPLSPAATLAAALGREAGYGAQWPLLERARERDTLLILDCCEHLIATVALLAERLFAAFPRLHILATSREPLRVGGEQVYRLGPLRFPTASQPLTASEAMRFSAIQLLERVIMASGLPFELMDGDVPIVTEICRRLDGIPLAIELVGARVGTYGIAAALEMLDSPQWLHWQGRRTALPRHRTLGATLEWSFNLLSKFERLTLQQFAARSGSFSLEDVQAPAADNAEPTQAVEALAALMDKSLVAEDTTGARKRYRLLNATRAYLLQRRPESDQESPLEREGWGAYPALRGKPCPRKTREGCSTNSCAVQ